MNHKTYNLEELTMAEQIIYRFEAILNYAKIEEKPDRDGNFHEHFTSQLIVDKENAPKLKKLLKDAKEAFPKAKPTVNELREGEKEVLGENFVKRIGCSTRKDWCKVQDLYGEELDAATLRSGDKVYIQVMADNSNYNGKPFLVLRPKLITLIQPQAYTLYDAQVELEKKNEDYFNDVKKYQQDASIQDDEAPVEKVDKAPVKKVDKAPVKKAQKEDYDDSIPW